MLRPCRVAAVVSLFGSPEACVLAVTRIATNSNPPLATILVFYSVSSPRFFRLVTPTPSYVCEMTLMQAPPVCKVDKEMKTTLPTPANAR